MKIDHLVRPEIPFMVVARPEKTLHCKAILRRDKHQIRNHVVNAIGFCSFVWVIILVNLYKKTIEKLFIILQVESDHKCHDTCPNLFHCQQLFFLHG